MLALPRFAAFITLHRRSCDSCLVLLPFAHFCSVHHSPQSVGKCPRRLSPFPRGCAFAIRCCYCCCHRSWFHANAIEAPSVHILYQFRITFAKTSSATQLSQIQLSTLYLHIIPQKYISDISSIPYLSHQPLPSLLFCPTTAQFGYQSTAKIASHYQNTYGISSLVGNMTSSRNSYKCFSITQAFLGAQLCFEPPLGSKEMDDLIEAYVPGPACKQDKLSKITIEFYKYATVDINTGSRVRTYNVCTAPAESPSSQSQSSGFSPSIYAPSPSSSAYFTDSGYGTSSFTTTPPVRARNSVSTTSSRAGVKKSSAKKERRSTSLAIETQKIPGFSIMTKDGVDVTTSAGRGTKTKEQREHAHLMRIMKACSDCKRKKVRVSVTLLFSGQVCRD